MRTRQQLAADLASFKAETVSELSGICTKTIYRIRRSEEYDPSLNTAEKLSRALDKLVSKRRVAKA